MSSLCLFFPHRNRNPPKSSPTESTPSAPPLTPVALYVSRNNFPPSQPLAPDPLVQPAKSYMYTARPPGVKVHFSFPPANNHPPQVSGPPQADMYMLQSTAWHVFPRQQLIHTRIMPRLLMGRTETTDPTLRNVGAGRLIHLASERGFLFQGRLSGSPGGNTLSAVDVQLLIINTCLQRM